MTTVAEELALVPFMRRVSTDEVRRVAQAFTRQRLTAGEVLWQYGEAVADLAILVEGELVAILAGREVGRVKAPDIIGEASAFFAGTTRTATLTADAGATVLVLTTPDLRALRFQKSAVYDVLLDYALRALVRRVANTSREIAKHAVGVEERVERKEPGALAKLWRSFRQAKPGVCPSLSPLLRQMPGMAELPTEIEAELVASFEPRSFSEGEVVVLEGEASDAMYIVADGELDVLRNVRGDKAELLTKLRSGQNFGANTMIESGPRTASCVGITPGWLYRMDRVNYDALRGDTRTRWQESILSTLASQIRNANGALSKALRAQEFAEEKARLARAGMGGGAGAAAVAGGAKFDRTYKPGQGHQDAVNAQSLIKFSYDGGVTGGADSGAAFGSGSPVGSSPPPGRRMSESDAFAELLKASGFLESLPTEEENLEHLTVATDDTTKRRKK